MYRRRACEATLGVPFRIGLVWNRQLATAADLWSAPAARRKFMDRVAAKYDVKEPKDWRRVSRAAVQEEGGRELLARFPSVFAVLQDSYPEEGLVEAECRRRVSDGYWDCREKRREFVEAVAKRQGVSRVQEMAKMAPSALSGMGGLPLLSRFSFSVPAIIADVFGEEALKSMEREGEEREGEKEVRRAQHPSGYWGDIRHQRMFLDHVAEEFHVRNASDWRQVRTKDIKLLGGSSLLARYSSTFLALQAAYPELELVEAECRPRLPAGYWHEEENRRQFLDKVARVHGVREAGDWRRVKYTDIVAMGGKGLLARYSTLYDAIRDCYGLDVDVTALVTRQQLPRGYWGEENHVRDFLKHVEQTYQVQSEEDWYRVSREQIIDVGGGTLLKKMSLVDALRLAYPKQTWSEELFENKAKKSTQRILLLHMQSLFQGGAQQKAESLL